MNTASNSLLRGVIFLFGPTAVGKSHLLYSLFNSSFEIINADSMQVYKYLNIGSAKPTELERQKIVHHLVDFLEPDVQFNVGDFVRSTERLIKEIHNRGKIPLISGGTAFYLKSLLYGLPEVPESNPEIRGALEKEMKGLGLDVLYKRLMEIDPAYGKKISSNDPLRILRALEVYEISGRPLSSFVPPDKMREDWSVLLICLNRDREELYARINARVELMFDQGLEEEVRSLMAKGFKLGDPGMKGIGYAEFFSRDGGAYSPAEIKAKIQQNSRRFAKRQLTFFRSFPEAHWVHPEKGEKIRELVQNFLGNRSVL